MCSSAPHISPQTVSKPCQRDKRGDAADVDDGYSNHAPDDAFSVSCIVVAVLGYGMMSMYWCCRLSIESGCCSLSPKEETSRNGKLVGLMVFGRQRDPCAIRRAIRPCPIPCHLTPWPGHRTTTRFKRQPAAPIHAHHSIAKDSDHNAGNGETKQ